MDPSKKERGETLRLIRGIEISYFRSIYKMRLDDLAEATILFGRNDCGKSNILRALNLFFSNETNPYQALDFVRDLCHARLAEAANLSGAHKFVSIEKALYSQ